MRHETFREAGESGDANTNASQKPAMTPRMQAAYRFFQEIGKERELEIDGYESNERNFRVNHMPVKATNPKFVIHDILHGMCGDWYSGEGEEERVAIQEVVQMFADPNVSPASLVYLGDPLISDYTPLDAACGGRMPTLQDAHTAIASLRAELQKAKEFNAMAAGLGTPDPYAAHIAPIKEISDQDIDEAYDLAVRQREMMMAITGGRPMFQLSVQELEAMPTPFMGYYLDPDNEYARPTFVEEEHRLELIRRLEEQFGPVTKPNADKTGWDLAF